MNADRIGHGRRTRWTPWMAAGFYTALTLVFTYPFSTQLATHVLSLGADMDLAVWTIGWDLHALTHRPWALFDANIFYPFTNTLAYSENQIGTALLAAPVAWLTGNTVLGMNFVVLFSVAASAYGAFLLARRLGLSTPAAFLAGLIFGFGPPRFFRIEQLHLTTIQWIPFALLALHTYFETGRPRDLRIAVALFSLQAITSGHGAAMLTLAVALLLIWKFLWGAPLDVVQRLRDLGWQGAAALLPAGLIYIPYRMVRMEVGLQRILDDAVLSLPSYVSSPTVVHQWLIGRMPDWDWLKSVPPDAYLFPGVVPLLLAGTAVWLHASSGRQPTVDTAAQGRAWRRSLNTPDHLWLYVGIFLVCVWLSIPPQWSIWRFTSWMPGLNFVRIPSRFTVLGLLALGIVAASGFDRLTSRARPRIRLAAAGVVAALLVGEFVPLPMRSEPYDIRPPAIDRWVGTQPQRMAILELPLADSRADQRREQWTTRFMLHSMAHWKPMFLGYSGIQPPGYQQRYWTFVGFPDEPSLALAREIGLTHIILHTDLVHPTERTAVEDRFARFAADVPLVHAEGEGRVYAIRPGQAQRRLQ